MTHLSTGKVSTGLLHHGVNIPQILTHCGLVTPYGDIQVHLGQYWPGLGSNTFFQIQIQIQIQVFRFCKYKYKYKYKYDEIFFSNTNTNTNTNIQIQIQIQIRLRFYSNTNIGIQIQIRFFTLYTTINISPNFSKMPLSDPETDPMLEYC